MYRIEWTSFVAPLGAVTLLMVPVFGAMLGLVVVLLIAVAIVVALVAAIVAPPLLLVRAMRRRWLSGRTTPSYTGQAKARNVSHETAVAVPRLNATAS